MRFAATNLNNFMDPMNFGAIGKADIMGQGLEERANIQGKAYVDRTEIKGNEIIGVAQAGLPAMAAEASAASQGFIMDGISSGIQGLAGGIAKRPGVGEGGGLGVNSPAGDAQVMGMSEFDSNYIQTPGNFIETDITGSGIGLPKYGSW